IFRIVLDAKDIEPIEHFPADERVLALLESESQEIRGRDELRFSNLPEQAVDVFRGVAGARLAARRRRSGGGGRRRGGRCEPGFAFLRTAEEFSFVLPT